MRFSFFTFLFFYFAFCFDHLWRIAESLFVNSLPQSSHVWIFPIPWLKDYCSSQWFLIFGFKRTSTSAASGRSWWQSSFRRTDIATACVCCALDRCALSCCSLAWTSCHTGNILYQFFIIINGISTRVGHADASADAHRMRINAHRCASSAYCAKNDIPFFTYKLPFWLRFSKSLGPEPHQLTNISYVESGEVLSFCVNEAREYLYRYLFQGGQTHYVENILLF